MGLSTVLCLLVLNGILLSQQMSACEGLRIAAFNIQQMGLSKSRDDTFTTPLTNFICAQDWDIAFLQELTSEEVIHTLTNKLNENSECKRKDILYSCVFSDKLPLEASSGREIYAYIYRESKICNLTAKVHQEQNQFTVGGVNFHADAFFRPPFVARVQVNTTAVPELECMPEFALIGIHTRPVRTYSELNGLVTVYDWKARVPGINGNALLLGDFNADCSTFGPVERTQNILYKERDIFHWLVEDGVKTNVAQSKDCAYDRIVAAGPTMTELVFNVSIPKWDPEERKLSDHWPVSVELKCPEQGMNMC